MLGTSIHLFLKMSRVVRGKSFILATRLKPKKSQFTADAHFKNNWLALCLLVKANCLNIIPKNFTSYTPLQAARVVIHNSQSH